MIAVRDEKLKAFADAYHEPLDPELKSLRDKQEAEGVPLIMSETESVLRLLLGLIRPVNILEIGTAYGYSALFFAKLLPEAHITTIDRNPYMTDEARAAFASHKEGERIDFREGDALDILKDLRNEISSEEGRGKFDFVFIDAGKSHYRDFMDIAEEMMTDDAFIVCDNILMKGWIVEPEGRDAKRHRTNIKYMHQFLDYIHERDDLDVTIMSGADGLAVIHKRPIRPKDL